MTVSVIPAQAGIQIDGAELDSRLRGNDEDLWFTSNATRLAGFAGAMLSWRPEVFWAATPAELATILMALADEGAGAAPAARPDLSRLMEQFPDG